VAKQNPHWSRPECTCSFRVLLAPLARYHRAQALDRKGDGPGAARDYRGFLEEWRGADADVPEVADARARTGTTTGGRG